MGSTAPVRLSVVIPALNEQQELPETLRRAQAVPEITEIIVSDGGSTDETIAIARDVGAQVVIGRSGRGAQLRLGAEYATGDVVILLHADTWLPRDAGKAILEVLGFNRTTSGGREGNRNIVGGGFRKTFRDAPWWLHSTASWRSMAYFRLRDEGYTPDDIKRWGDTVARETASAKDVYVYFKHEEEGKGPEFAKLLMQHLGLASVT